MPEGTAGGVALVADTPNTRKNVESLLVIGTLTLIVPLLLTANPVNPAQFVCHGPLNNDAHWTEATVPVCNPEHTNTPFWLNELMTMDWPSA